MSIVARLHLTVGDCRLLGNNVLPAAGPTDEEPFAACRRHPPYRRVSPARLQRRRLPRVQTPR